jgi:hypothetical protein
MVPWGHHLITSQDFRFRFASACWRAGLAGQELPFECSGDGDDANLCFVGSNGFLGVETGTVRLTAVDAATVTFTFSSSFAVYDGQGGQSPTEIGASGSGTAHVSG